MPITAPFTGALERVGISGWIIKSKWPGGIFSQLVGIKMAIAEAGKCSSETQNVPAGHVIKVVEAAVEYAQWLF